MWRSISALASVAVILIIMQVQVGNLMVPAPAGAAGNAQQPMWTLFPLPANVKTVAQKRAEKKAQEEGTLLRLFAKPHPFTAEKEGYRIVFPGKPTVP